MKKLINRFKRWWRTGRLEVRENLDAYPSANDAYLWARVDVRGVTGEHAWLNGEREVAFTVNDLLEAVRRGHKNQTDKPGDMRD